MINSPFSKICWTHLQIDRALNIIGVENPDRKLFSGSMPEPGRNLDDLLPFDATSQRQSVLIAEAMSLAEKENRSVYLEFVSQVDGEQVSVAAHVECCTDKNFCMSAAVIDAADMDRARSMSEREPSQSPCSHGKTILDSLPVGTEIYSADGQLLYMSDGFSRIFRAEKGQIPPPSLRSRIISTYPIR